MVRCLTLGSIVSSIWRRLKIEIETQDHRFFLLVAADLFGEHSIDWTSKELVLKLLVQRKSDQRSFVEKMIVYPML